MLRNSYNFHEENKYLNNKVKCIKSYSLTSLFFAIKFTEIFLPANDRSIYFPFCIQIGDRLLGDEKG